MVTGIVRKVVISATLAIDCIIDTIPAGIRNRVSRSTELASFGLAVAIPLLYAAANKNSSFLNRG